MLFRSIEIEVVLSQPAKIAGSITYRLGALTTAASGVDFNFNEGTLIFSPGQLRKTIALEVLDNNEIENNKKEIQIHLEGASDLSLGDFTTTLIEITNDD